MKTLDLSQPKRKKLRQSLGCLVVILLTLLVCSVLLSPLAPIHMTLYEMFFPIDTIGVPVPKDTERVSTRTGGGSCVTVYEDTYVSDHSTQEMIDFYESEGATCDREFQSSPSYPKAQVCWKTNFYISGSYLAYIYSYSDYAVYLGSNAPLGETVLLTEMDWPNPNRAEICR